MIAVALLAATLSVAPSSFSLKPAPPALTQRQAERLKALEPCRTLNAQMAAYRRQQSRGAAPRTPKGQYAVIRSIGGCGVSTPMR